MLELRPICENCGKDLPNESTDPMKPVDKEKFEPLLVSNKNIPPNER
jgi:hypothetical protein